MSAVNRFLVSVPTAMPIGRFNNANREAWAQRDEARRLADANREAWTQRAIAAEARKGGSGLKERAQKLSEGLIKRFIERRGFESL